AAPDAPAAWWLAAGACAGLAMLSKYHGVFLLAGAGLFLLTRRDAWHWLRHPAPYCGVAIAALLSSPVLLWNAQHNWISLHFQGARGAPQHGLHLLPFLQNVGGQLGYLLPWIGIPLAWALARVLIAGLRAGEESGSSARTGAGASATEESRLRTARWLLACLAIGPIAAFTLVSLGGQRGLPHWQSPGWLMAIPLLAERADVVLTSGSARARRITERWLAASTVAFVALMLVVATQARSGWMERVVSPRLASVDPTVEMLDWRELPAAVAPLLRATDSVSGSPTAPAFVAATNWMDAAKISIALNGRAEVVCLCSEPHHFAFLADQRSYLSRDAIIVVRARRSAPAPLADYFRSVEPAGTVDVRRGGRPAIVLELYRGRALVAAVPARAP
ncbi:MAG: glycosyltransferase family 39 protein, partial [Gemmatimonadaceae bacterium]|nr:glycosyltransferase family 39 protein [Gemmatimonadaceae bacterium]